MQMGPPCVWSRSIPNKVTVLAWLSTVSIRYRYGIDTVLYRSVLLLVSIRHGTVPYYGRPS